MNFWTIIIIFLVLISLDKTLTFINLSQVQKTNPDNYLSIEKNPAARWFFEHYGLLGGTIAYGLITMITLFFVFYLFSFVMSTERTMWIIFLIYSVVIGNNIFFALKFHGLLN